MIPLADPLIKRKVKQHLDALFSDFFLHWAMSSSRLIACVLGAVGALLSKIEGFVTSSGKDGHAVGDSLTLADIFLFAVGTAFVSGTFDGVPEDLFAAYPNIEGVRKTVAAHPDVIAYYAGRTDSGSQYVIKKKKKCWTQLISGVWGRD